MSALNQFSLTGKVVIITGATGVLGAAMSVAVAEAGARVVVMGRDAERGEARAAAIRAIGGEALVILADVLDTAQLEAARDQILATWGRIDGLVNAAGGNLAGATVRRPAHECHRARRVPDRAKPPPHARSRRRPYRARPDASKFVTGETVLVDGGFNAYSGV
uniref:3-oxoacyl-[acyl-carrier-protein] reductase 4-like n=1 Tax=Tanacetum cinerariifolium TaxID=118510 RepID=A0A699QZM7_TANCI|nr:3-oxoacyl-[acyl-carrier-protein] reductase 4-like [Tanacetum cinerariifolium]